MTTKYPMVAGYCPMGCGQTLSVMGDGYVTCRSLDCPQPDAVSRILDERETEHIVTFGQTEFIMRHPLRERINGELEACSLHVFVNALGGPPVRPGSYRATRASSGDWGIWTPIS